MSTSAEISSAVVRILLLEGDDADAALIAQRLGESGIVFELKRVTRLAEFEAANQAEVFDLILSAFHLDDGDGWRALDTARDTRPTVPFIFVSGVMNEALEVEGLRRGAMDCVTKDRLSRLAPAVRRALAERDIRAGLRETATALRKQELYFRLIAENTRDIICLHAADRTVYFASPAVRTLLGYAQSEWLGRRVRDFFHPEDTAAFGREIEEMETGSADRRSLVMRMRHKQGLYMWMETRVDPVHDEQGRVAQFISISRDFTERHRVEEEMRRGEKLFEGIAEANRLLLTTTRVTESLPALLRAVGEAAECDRVIVFEFRPHSRTGQPVTALRAEWSREPELSLFRDARMVELPVGELGSGSTAARIAAGETVETFIEQSNPAERKLLEEHKVLCVLSFPIVVAGRVWGHVSFDQCKQVRTWLAGERTALATVASNIGQAIGREAALAALAESERRYEALISGLSEGVFHIDLEARWRFLNPTWYDLTGHEIEDCLGRRFSDFLLPEDAIAALEAFGRLISGRDSRVEAEVRFRHRSGEGIWLRVTAQPQIDDTGRIVGVSGTLVDVTQRRHAQEALRASERKFSAVFASASDALLLVDTATNLVVECNPRAAEMFDCEKPSALVGINAAALERRPLDPREAEPVRARLSRGEVWSREAECVSRHGRVFWGQLAVVRMAPEALGITLFRITDITEIKRSEERLRASLAEKEVLLKEVYHRVKNNLQIISALLRMQTRRVKDRVALEALENSISRVMAMSMVHEKLYQAQNLVSIDFFSFAQSLVGFLNQLAAGGKAPLRIDVTGAPLALSIDQAIPLGLVLNELVTNSIKYAFPEGRGGHIGIHIAQDGAHAARVVVADNGVGLPPGVDVENSTGLGFRIVHMLVEQLQGTLQIESRTGLSVNVHFPIPPERTREAGV